MANYFVHEKALVETSNIGKDSKIWAFVHILEGARIGDNTNICDHCFVENDVVIGDNVTIKCGVYLWDGVRLENNVFVGPAAVFTNDLLPRSKNTAYEQKQTLVKEGASIGANATTLAGVTIGQYSLIGAGAVITKDVPDFALVYGNPGKVQGYVCICAKKIDTSASTFRCTCGREYTTLDGKVSLQ